MADEQAVVPIGLSMPIIYREAMHERARQKGFRSASEYMRCLLYNDLPRAKQRELKQAGEVRERGRPTR